MDRMNISDEVFERLWNALSSAEQVAQVMGYPVDTVRHRAMTLRKQDVYMKSMRRDELDAGELANVATRCRGTLQGEDFDPTAREFVLLWQLCDSATDVAKITGMSYNAVKTRGKAYRIIGVPLKRFARGRRPAMVSPDGKDANALEDADNITSEEDE